jgi:hypothetical protein
MNMRSVAFGLIVVGVSVLAMTASSFVVVPSTPQGRVLVTFQKNQDRMPLEADNRFDQYFGTNRPAQVIPGTEPETTRVIKGAPLLQQPAETTVASGG